MDSFLIVGAETVVGANLAAYLAEDSPAPVATLSEREVEIRGCRTHTGDASGAQARTWVQQVSPTHVVLCGPAARSSWEQRNNADGDGVAAQAAGWAAACRDAGCRLTFISSDAVFTGPWMFHEEDSTARCESPLAVEIRRAEQAVQSEHPQALVVRTNAFGWSPLGESGWIEQRLAELRASRLADQDHIRHATPILATDLAGILVRAWSEGLSGTHHIAGAERISPLRFVQRLAEHYHLPWLSLRRPEALLERALGFGAGECSLQTKRIRKAVCVAMPMISEGLSRLVEQDASGHRDRLLGGMTGACERAA